MSFDFNSLPEVTDFITAPSFDQDITDITSLALKRDMIRNPLAGNLRSSIGNLNSAVATISRTQTKLESRIQNTTKFGRRGVLGPDGLGASAHRAAAVGKSNAQIQTALSSLNSSKQGLVSALSQSNRMLDHTNLMTNNIGVVGNMVNDAIAAPSRFTSEFVGKLPVSFPTKMPSFLRSPVGGSIPNFSGVSIPGGLPNVGLPPVSVTGLPDLKSLPGVSVPGAPNPTQVLQGFAGSLNGGLGGVGGQLTSSLSTYASKAPGLANLATQAVGGLGVGLNDVSLNPLDTATGLPLSTPTLTPQNLDALNNLSDLSGAMGEFSGGMSDMIGQEEGGVFAATCSQLSGGGACGSLPSLSDAVGSASLLSNLSKTATSAKLMDSVATGPMKSKLANVQTKALTQAQQIIPGFG